MIDPVMLGGGKRLFSDDGALRALQLVDSQVTTTAAASSRQSGVSIVKLP